MWSALCVRCIGPSAEPHSQGPQRPAAFQVSGTAVGALRYAEVRLSGAVCVCVCEIAALGLLFDALAQEARRNETTRRVLDP